MSPAPDLSPLSVQGQCRCPGLAYCHISYSIPSDSSRTVLCTVLYCTVLDSKRLMAPIPLAASPGRLCRPSCVCVCVCASACVCGFRHLFERRSVCVAFVAVAGRRCTYTVRVYSCTPYIYRPCVYTVHYYKCTTKVTKAPAHEGAGDVKKGYSGFSKLSTYQRLLKAG